MPTRLGTAELQRLDGDILRSSLFSARTTMRSYLEKIREQVRLMIDPQPGVRTRDDGTPITEGINLADARVELRDVLRQLGYQPAPEERGTLRDLSSEARLDLVVRTNVEISQGYGQWVQGMDEDVLDAFPAQELYRAGSPKVARDWYRRWRVAAGVVGDTDALRILEGRGIMVARKDSPIWQALGDGLGLPANEASDALHNPYPPYAFNSQMDVRDVDRSTAVELGLVRMEERVEPQQQEFPGSQAEQEARDVG
jgi:hypothetical protein